MNQTKMDEYKEYKKNRKEVLAKEKKQQKTRKTVTVAVLTAIALLLVVALGITGANAISEWKAARPNYDRSEMIIEDVAGVLSLQNDAEIVPEDETK